VGVGDLLAHVKPQTHDTHVSHLARRHWLVEGFEDVRLPPELNIYTIEDNQRIFDRSASDDNTIFNTIKINLDFKVSRGDITLLPNLDDIIDPSFLD